jgi:hypothetical protein
VRRGARALLSVRGGVGCNSVKNNADGLKRGGLETGNLIVPWDLYRFHPLP